MIIASIQNVPILLTIQQGREVVEFTADMDVDCDGGGGNPQHDPYFQPDTSYHYKDAPLIAEDVPYVVVPPVVIQRTKGVVMGCQAYCTNKDTGVRVAAVVGDRGPTRKIGEGSVKLCEMLGLSGNPNTGGTSLHVIHYEVYPGTPAVVDGVTYPLQPS